MANLLSRLINGNRDIATIDDYIAATGGILGWGSLEQTLTDGRIKVGQDFPALSSVFSRDSVVYTCMDIRMKVFSAARFRWQRMRNGKASDYFSSMVLDVLDRPWPGGTTQDLMARAVMDADLAGNSFWVRPERDLVRLRPDWVEVVVRERRYRGGQVGWNKVGYIYTEGGPHSGNDGVGFTAEEVAHFMPVPDPINEFRGMSWLTPVIREIEGDLTMTRHKRKFFENGATPNMIIKHDRGANRDKILDFAKRLDAEQSGTDNAYRTLHLYPGADATVVGADLKSIDFKSVQGAGETRIAAAAGVPAVVAGFSEGLSGSSLNAGNYGQARRRFADGTMHPLWANFAGSMAQVLESPGSDVRLWYDADDVPFLREDEKDAAEIAQVKATTMRSLIDAGYAPDSVALAVESQDFRLLQHTGLFSVQLQPANSSNTVQQARAALEWARSVAEREGITQGGQDDGDPA